MDRVNAHISIKKGWGLIEGAGGEIMGWEGIKNKQN